jgi:hypothetical protein
MGLTTLKCYNWQNNYVSYLRHVWCVEHVIVIISLTLGPNVVSCHFLFAFFLHAMC